MNIGEAIGVKDYVDIKTGEELSYKEFYCRAIDYLGGAKAVEPYLPAPLDKICEKLKSDPNLNNIPLWSWDAAAGFLCKPLRSGTQACKPTGCGLWKLLREHGITPMSCAQGVSILKEAAHILLKEEREYA